MNKEPKHSKDHFKIRVDILTVIAVGVFFAYRFFTGWMSANMDIVIEPSRAHLNDQEDYLAVIVRLERGEYGSVKLGDAQVRITYVDSTESPTVLPLVGTERLADSGGKLDWKPSPDKPLLILHAKEKSEFAAALKVPRKTACMIEIAVSTYRRLDDIEWLWGFRWGQRRSSTVSLPLSDKATP
jgi:hypothetical protein